MPHASSSSVLTPPSSPPPQPVDSISQTNTSQTATETVIITNNTDLSNANLILNDEQMNNTSLLKKLNDQNQLSRQSSATFSSKSRSSKRSSKITASSSAIQPNQTTAATTSSTSPLPLLPATLLSRPSLSLTGDSVKFHITQPTSSSRSKKKHNKKSKRQNLESIGTSGLTGSTSYNESIGTSHNVQVPSSVYSQGTVATATNLDHISVNGAVDSSSASQVVVLRDPVLIRGAGNITIFGICNKFSDQFPTALNSKLAPEEFQDTMRQINSVLSDEVESSLKWLVLGSLFCCCTLGCSFLPVVYMNKRAKSHIEKLLEVENQRLYLKLGLKWRLSKTKYNSVNSLLEYVLVIDFLPNVLLYQPD